MALLQDSQRFKQHLAKKFAANYTPRRALLHMADAEIPPEQRPDLTQLKNRRPTQATSKSRVVPVHSLGDLQKFIQAPPENIQIFDDLVEFDAFWQNIFRRMEGQALATDFGEPRMAAYLQKHIFDTAGPLVKAPWCSGLGAVLEGYSCYAANTIESGHKSLKHLLSGAPRHRNVGQLYFRCLKL